MNTIEVFCAWLGGSEATCGPALTGGIGFVISVWGLVITYRTFYRTGRIESRYQRKGLVGPLKSKLLAHKKNLAACQKNSSSDRARVELASCRATVGALKRLPGEPDLAKDISALESKLDKILGLPAGGQISLADIQHAIELITTLAESLLHEEERAGWRSADAD